MIACGLHSWRNGKFYGIAFSTERCIPTVCDSLLARIFHGVGFFERGRCDKIRLCNSLLQTLTTNDKNTEYREIRRQDSPIGQNQRPFRQNEAGQNHLRFLEKNSVVPRDELCIMISYHEESKLLKSLW